jgi:diaminopimelate decarboxylase
MNHDFHYPPSMLKFWRDLVQARGGRQPTPFYLFSIRPMERALAELDSAFGHLPVRHWLSCKTQPLPPLLRWWREQGLGIEVVSEFELLAALKEGFPPERILLNGPAKHQWLPRHPVRGVSVNLDSVNEAVVLAPLARELGWRIGLRLNTAEEFDPQAPAFPTQFGLGLEEAQTVLQLFHELGIFPEIVHFHLRTNVAAAAIYERALKQAAEMCREAGLKPRVIDCGGGFPPPHVLTRRGHRLDARFRLPEMAKVYERGLNLFPGVEEIWLENGRWLSAGSGVLVVKVLDVKERRGLRHLICDGGRALQALISIWEEHELIALEPREGASVLTTVAGPTCMAFDQLVRRPLPASLRPGDYLVWLDAGAYHLPWETRFSHGLAAVLWHEGNRVKVVRGREEFDDWWGRWR